MSEEKEITLPKWAKVGPESNKVSIIIEVDTDAAMQEWIGLLEVTELDQYWLETAYQCAKMDVQKSIEGTKYDPRVAGKSAEFRFSRAENWAQAQYPAGRGAAAATKGHQARMHYTLIRRSLPFSSTATE